MTVLPHVSALYQAYLGLGSGSGPDGVLPEWYGAGLRGGWMAGAWMGRPVPGGREPERLAGAMREQAERWGASAAQQENVDRLGRGARAVVTGQQVGLLGGPLLVLEKAATAVTRAREATTRTGVEHVPVFWLATEDHDLPEVDQVGLLDGAVKAGGFEVLRAGLEGNGGEVGAVVLGERIEAVLARAEEMLGWAPVCELLRECYRPERTLGEAFARLLTRVFADEGLVVMDAAGRVFHELGRDALRYAAEHADELERTLVERSEALEAAGFHAQVKVAEGMSLLFLLGEDGARVALRRTAEGGWKAGRQTLSTEELLGILEREPERVSPNALLRPVFQDTILPTAAYVGGPAEVAYWAQAAVVYEAVLGGVTPVLPRLSATLLTPGVAEAMRKFEVELPQAMSSAEELALRLGARSMPIELKRKLSAVGTAMDAEVAALLEYVRAMDESLGRAAEVSGSKMRYQMTRLRRMMARHEAEKEGALRKHAEAIVREVWPGGHVQERALGWVWFLARTEGLVGRLVEEAAGMCGGHAVVLL